MSRDNVTALERRRARDGAPDAESAAHIYRADLERARARVAHKKLASREYRAMLRALGHYGGCLARGSGQPGQDLVRPAPGTRQDHRVRAASF